MRDAEGSAAAPEDIAHRVRDALSDYGSRKQRDRDKLDHMVKYCQQVRCRTRAILDYFGEEVDSADWRCGNCDACDLLGKWEDSRPTVTQPV